MTKAIDTTTTPADTFWSKFRKAEAAAEKEPPLVAEAKLCASVENAATFSRNVWAKPATPDDAKLRAEVCAYWTGGYRDENGALHLPDLTSDDLGKRAVAELLLADLAPKT
jgi:hypothetical protein